MLRINLKLFILITISTLLIPFTNAQEGEPVDFGDSGIEVVVEAAETLWAYWFPDEFNNYFPDWITWTPSFPPPVPPPDTGDGGQVDCKDVIEALGDMLDIMEGVNGMMNAASMEYISEFDPETGKAIVKTTYSPGSQFFTDSLADKIKWKIDAEKRLDQLFKDAANCNEKTP